MQGHHQDETFEQGLDKVIEQQCFQACVFRGLDLSDGQWRHCQFIDCQFIGCNLSNLNLLGSQFERVQFEQCKMIGIDWTLAKWLDYVFEATVCFNDCRLCDSSFFGLELDDLQLTNCIAHRVDFREGRFVSADFSGSDFANSLFNRTNLSRSDFSDALNYHMDLTANTLTKAKFSRAQALCLLAFADIQLLD
ncbi:pentapeptide repeat-containing protein [Motilimonas sp. KMU-193]|uniref:pentapeptide repeat-containing protein n=1 Tax=Motilimonas sp. KMU-193 TaxID=3388668 RepID=UPI00396AFDAF